MRRRARLWFGGDEDGPIMHTGDGDRRSSARAAANFSVRLCLPGHKLGHSARTGGTTVRSVVVRLAVGVVATLALVGIFVLARTPSWNFYLGGHFHPLGGWQGKGTLHSTTAGGDYTMWIQLEAAPRNRFGGSSTLKGSAVLCSPRGENLRLDIWGNALRSHGADLTAVPLHFQMNQWMPLFLPGADRKPHLDFYGTFGDDVLILEDRGSVGLAFTPDGRVRESVAKAPSGVENSRVTFEKSTLSRLPDWCLM